MSHFKSEYWKQINIDKEDKWKVTVEQELVLMRWTKENNNKTKPKLNKLWKNEASALGRPQERLKKKWNCPIPERDYS